MTTFRTEYSGETNCLWFLIIFHYLDCTKCKFPDFSLTFPNIHFFPWPSTKFLDFSLTFAKSGISLTFPWPLDTLHTYWSSMAIIHSDMLHDTVHHPTKFQTNISKLDLFGTDGPRGSWTHETTTIPFSNDGAKGKNAYELFEFENSWDLNSVKYTHLSREMLWALRVKSLQAI